MDEFDLLRRRAEFPPRLGGSLPAAFASVMCLRNAPPSRVDSLLVLASVPGRLGIVGIARQTRRLFGQMGGAGRQDAPFAAEGGEMKKSSPGCEDSDSWTARRGAKIKLKSEGNGAGKREGGRYGERGAGETEWH